MSINSFSKTTTRMIADKAEIFVGTIYNHLCNKDDTLNYRYLVEHNKRKGYCVRQLKNDPLGVRT